MYKGVFCPLGRKALFHLQILVVLALTPLLTIATNVTIDVSNSVFSVTDTALGVHTSVYDNQNGNAALPGRLIESGVTALRYPGGGYADVYHWSANKDSPWFADTNNFGYIGPNVDFGHFISLLTNSHSQAIITVDYGSGQRWNGGKTQMVIPGTNATPEEAAAWVAYANASTNVFIYGSPTDQVIGNDALSNNWKTVGFWAKLRASTPAQFSAWAGSNFDSTLSFLAINQPVPVGVKYWEIGNETFGTGFYDGSDGYSVSYAVPYDTTDRFNHPSLSPLFYGGKVSLFSQAMKAVDPTIKIGAVVSTPPGDFSWDSISGKHWTTQVLAQCASQIDFVIAHWYPYAGSYADGSNLLSQVQTTIPLMINGKTANLDVNGNAGLRDQIKLYRPADSTNVQIFITEFGYSGNLTNGTPNGAGGVTNPVAGPVDALFAADCYSTWMNLGVANVDYLEMNAPNFLGDSGLPRGGVFFAVEMVRKLGVTGDRILNANSDNKFLRAQAVLQQTKKLGLLLINENANSNQTITITITNVVLAGGGSRYQFGVTNFSSTSPATSFLPTSGPTTNLLSGLTNSFSVMVPAYTMVSLVLDLSTNTPPVLPAIGNQSVNIGTTVAFNASGTDAQSPPQILAYSLVTNPPNATVDGPSGAFSWRPQVTDANTTNLIGIKVADNGVPSMSATQFFTLTVNPLVSPVVETIASPANQITLQVTGQTGPDYEIETSTNLFDWTPVWVTNSPPQPFSWTDTNLTEQPMRYYRVKTGPPLP